MYIALKTYDDVGNVSGLSNVADARTRKSPAAITDLRITSASGTASRAPVLRRHGRPR